MANSNKIKVGRPRKYNTTGDLIDAVEKYLNENDPSDYTISGLCIALGITRETLSQWGKPNHEFSDIINMSRLHVINSYEVLLKGKSNSAGAIFALRNLQRDYWKTENFVDIKSDGKELKQNVFYIPNQTDE